MEVSFGSKLHNNVEVVLICKGLVQFDDVGMVKLAEDSYF